MWYTWGYFWLICAALSTQKSTVPQEWSEHVSSEQLEELRKSFAISNYLSPAMKRSLSQRLNLNEMRISGWFHDYRLCQVRSGNPIVRCKCKTQCVTHWAHARSGTIVLWAYMYLTRCYKLHPKKDSITNPNWCHGARPYPGQKLQGNQWPEAIILPLWHFATG